MPNVNLSKTTILELLKKKMKDVELFNAISMIGPSVAAMGDEEIELEVTANRPDLLSEQGLARALSCFIGTKQGLKKYNVKKSNQKVIVDDSVSSVRPYTACAIIKGLKCSDEKIKEIIQIQEKLHITYGRNRKKCAIGIYPLEHIRPPIRFMAKKPEDIIFSPLDLNKELSAPQILVLHPTGRQYGDLLKNEKKYPIFIDSKNNILSMPPIINSNTVGKITEKTKDMFVEVSGFDFEYLNTALCIIVTALADMGGEICSMEVQYKGKKRITPDFTPIQFNLEPAAINKRLGTDLPEHSIRKLLAKMGHDYNNKTVFSPRWRADLQHPVDLIEDIAIAIGYDNIPKQKPTLATIGKISEQEVLYNQLRDVFIGAGFIEVKNYHLISEAAQTKLLNNSQKPIKLANAFSEDYSTLRSNLLPGIMQTFKENKSAEYPQMIFEIGTTFKEDREEENLVKEETRLGVALSDTTAHFTKIKQAIKLLGESFAIQIDVQELQNSPLSAAFIEGRCGIVSVEGNAAGILGEIHPSVLENFQLEMPIAYAEIDTKAIADAIKSATSTERQQEKNAKQQKSQKK